MGVAGSKTAAIYSVWDGEEHLQGSIEQILPFVDVVIAVTQDVSYSGNKYTGGEAEAWRLHKLGLIDQIVKTDYIDLAMNMETHKRNLGIRVAKDLKCTHFIFVDCDEYYDSNQFAAAKTEVINNGYAASACRLYTYFQRPEYRLTPMEDYYVPFICELDKYTKAGQFPFPAYVDPTRRINTHQPFRKFEPEELVMHHYSFVRKDIRRKLANSSAAKNFRKSIDDLSDKISAYQLGQELPYYGERHSIEVVPDFFNIGWPLRSTL